MVKLKQRAAPGGRVYRIKGNRFWWMAYRGPGGQLIRQTTRTTSRAAAEAVLAARVTTTPSHGKGDLDASPSFQNAVSFAFGHVQAWLDIYAAGAGLPPTLFTDRVAGLLRRAARGTVLGPQDHVPDVRGHAAT